MHILLSHSTKLLLEREGGREEREEERKGRERGKGGREEREGERGREGEREGEGGREVGRKRRETERHRKYPHITHITENHMFITVPLVQLCPKLRRGVGTEREGKMRSGDREREGKMRRGEQNTESKWTKEREE